MMQTSTDCTQIGTSSKKVEPVSTPQDVNSISISLSCDILLNNFEIKKRQHRVLLNCDHIVWEGLHAKSSADTECMPKKGGPESDQLSCQTSYDSSAKIMHINQLIRVSKGNTKGEALLNSFPHPASQFDSDTVSNQQEVSPNTNISPTERYLALSYASRVIKSATDCNRWEVRKLMLYNKDGYVVRQWHDQLNKILANSSSTRLRIRRLLVFINPYGGRQKALNIYERHCKPLFMLAGIDASCIISQRANQIRDILLSHDLAPFDAVCCVGGDGTVAEVVNGLIIRAICDKGMDPLHPPYIPKPSLPIAIIPAGSTDTVAYSLHGTSDIRTAVIHLILGQRRGMDICSVRNREGIVRFCASLLSYGYLGDVAAKSERYRWMGTKRYEFTGFKTFLVNNSYRAELRVLQPIDDNNRYEKEISTRSGNAEVSPGIPIEAICCADCIRCHTATETEVKVAAKNDLLNKVQRNNELSPSSSVSSKRSNDHFVHSRAPYNKNDDSSQLEKHKNFYDLTNIDLKECDKITESGDVETNGMGRDGTLVKLKNAISNKELCKQWKIINGKFFMISGTNITCACERSPNGLARYSHIGDGYLDLILVRKTSLFNNVRLLLNMMSRNGEIRNLPFVETYRTKRFCFRSTNSKFSEDNIISGSSQPIASTAGDGDCTHGENLSHWNCDGEVISDQELTMMSRASAEQLRVMVDILSETEGLASGRFQRLHGKLEYQKKWREMSEKLNTVGGASKTVEQWNTVWRDLKRRTSNHVRDLNNQRALTGNRPISLPPLTDLELRIVDLIGDRYVEGADICDDSIPREEVVEEDDEIPWSESNGTIIIPLTPPPATPTPPPATPTPAAATPRAAIATPRAATARAATPRAATSRAASATPRRGTKRRCENGCCDDDRQRFLDIAENQAETMRILAENQPKQTDAIVRLEKILEELVRAIRN